jgi:hypothetical protein|tara:strand:- start:33 stop:695 length:663 start_codon:yes stop_codon:yes gene_type:complete
MKKFGIRTTGLEYIFETTISNYILKNNYKENFTFLEVGSAGCVSMKSFYEIVKETIKHEDWSIQGLDLCEGWSLDWDEINSFDGLTIFKEGELIKEGNLNSTLNLTDKPREWVSETFAENSIDICFIDGCHGSKCVYKDFITVEPKIKTGGIVMFHDSGMAEMNTDWQDCCKEYINVRKGIHDAGLLDFNKNTKWQALADIIGSRVHGLDGNGLFITRKR